MQHPKMYGIAGFEKSLTPHEVARDVSEFETALAKMRLNPPGNSETLRAFSVAAIADLHDDTFPEYKQLVEGFIRDRPDMEAPYKVQVFWRTFQFILLERTNDERYPYEYGNPHTWNVVNRTILADEPGKLNKEGWTLKELLAVNNNQTNEPRRYAGVKLAIAAHADKLPATPTMVDAGCSAGLGQIQIGENIPFRGIRIEHDSLTVRKMIREQFLAKLAISNNIGFDKVVGTDPRWVEACSYYPSELMDSKVNQSKHKFRKLLYRRRDNFIRVHGDLTEGPEGLRDVMACNNDDPYNVATALTAVYEVPEEQAPIAMKSLNSLSDTLVIVQDFAEIDQNNPSELVFNNDIYDKKSARYNLFTRVQGEDDDRWSHLGTWSSGRCATFNPTQQLIDKIIKQS